MRPVLRWFRVLVIALLLPAYGLAAVGTTPSLAGLADAQAKLRAGADLVQVYTGLIYKGPALVKECAEALARL